MGMTIMMTMVDAQAVAAVGPRVAVSGTVSVASCPIDVPAPTISGLWHELQNLPIGPYLMDET